jgi:hypothetical protein
MDGFDFGIPATLLSYSTIGLGAVFIFLGWVFVVVNGATNRRWRIPAALYALSAAVGIELTGLIVLSHLPYYMTDQEILGFKLVSFVWSCFLIVSFGLVLLSVVLARRESGPASLILRSASIILSFVGALGFVGIILGLPGMPLH